MCQPSSSKNKYKIGDDSKSADCEKRAARILKIIEAVQNMQDKDRALTQVLAFVDSLKNQ